MKTKSKTGSQRVVVASILAASVSLAFQEPLFASQLSFAHAPPSALACAGMVGYSIPPFLIGQPTNGAVVSSATLVAASGSGAASLGSYCRVSGQIRPIDPTAPDITFLVNLPVEWNRKAMMFAGAGFDGEQIFINFVHAGTSTQLSPLGRGYAVFGSDGGHVQNEPYIFGRDGSFAVNDEALDNYASLALKKTRDVAINIITSYYGRVPERTYIHGGSNGGRETLKAIQQWPNDFDGAIAIYPVMSFAGWLLQGARISQSIAVPGAYMNGAKRKLVQDVGISACDMLDGVADGVISNVAACNRLFNAPGSPALAQLRCPGGADTGDTCLSDTQIAVLKTFNSKLNYAQPLANGITSSPGLNIWGSDLGIPSTNPDVFILQIVGLNQAPPSSPVQPDQPGLSVYSDQWLKYFVTRDPGFNSLTFDPVNWGTWGNRIRVLSGKLDPTNPNLSVFRQRGGKLLMMHGSADAIVSNQASAEYFQSVQATLGKGRTSSFMKYYEIPGYAHSTSGIFNAGWDSVRALEQWVEQGKAPKRQIVEDKTGVPGRTRPLCEFPGWPAYKGHGDINLASSFKCVMNRDDDDDQHQFGQDEADDD